MADNRSYEVTVTCSNCGQSTTLLASHEEIRTGTIPSLHRLDPHFMRRRRGSYETFCCCEEPAADRNSLSIICSFHQASNRQSVVTNAPRSPPPSPATSTLTISPLSSALDEPPIRCHRSPSARPVSLPSKPSVPTFKVVTPICRSISLPQLPPRSAYSDNIFGQEVPYKTIQRALAARGSLDCFALVYVTRDQKTSSPPYLVLSNMKPPRSPGGGSTNTDHLMCIDQNRARKYRLKYLCDNTAGEIFDSIEELLTHYRKKPTRFGGYLSRQLKLEDVFRNEERVV